jgi:hypothetical protein
VTGQSETESGTNDQSKQLYKVYQFMKNRKAGASIKKSMIPKFYDHNSYQVKTISVVDYEKERLNIAIMEPRLEKSKKHLY